MKQATHLALSILASHPYAAALVGFGAAMSYGLAKLATLLPTL